MKTPAAASEASVSAPMLKSTLWSGARRALHSTATIVTASASAARGPKSAAPASAADGADRDRAAVVDLERERLADADERDDREQADEVGARAEDEARAMPAAMPSELTTPTTTASAARARRSAARATACGLRLARRSSRRSGSAAAGGARERHVLVAVLAATATSRRGARSAGEQQRLGARAEDAVAALQLGAVDGEVGLVDQLVRVGAVLRVAGDADRDRGADRLARGLDLERALGDGAADPLGDLQRLLRRRLREQDRELLAAEARRHVVVAELLRGRPPRSPSAPRRRRGGRSVLLMSRSRSRSAMISDSGRSKRCGAGELLGERGGEVAGVEEAGLRVDAGLGLQLRARAASGGSGSAARARRDQPRVLARTRRRPRRGRPARGRWTGSRAEEPGLAQRVARARAGASARAGCG